MHRERVRQIQLEALETLRGILRSDGVPREVLSSDRFGTPAGFSDPRLPGHARRGTLYLRHEEHGAGYTREIRPGFPL